MGEFAIKCAPPLFYYEIDLNENKTQTFAFSIAFFES